MFCIDSLVVKNQTNDKWNKILEELEEILNYKFDDINLLKEALIHHTYYGKHYCPKDNGINYLVNYEKLEVLGDSLLDCIVNSSLIKYGVERNITPYEVHHAKSKIVNNELLSKIVV